MARALEELAHTRERNALAFDDQLALLIEREAADRANLALTHRLRWAHLRQNACLENLDLRTPRGLDRTLVRDLASCRWVGERRPILVIGPTGIGKTWIVCALGNQAAREGHAVLYQPVDEVLNWSPTHNIWWIKLRVTALCSRSIAGQRLRQRAAIPGLIAC